VSIRITGAPCSWGVDDINNPHLPPWRTVLREASLAGYEAIELGPYGYLPIDIDMVSAELAQNNLSIVAGTIFDDLLADENYGSILEHVDEICSLITKLPLLPTEARQHFKTPYLTIMDWGHDERDFSAGHSDRAPRLSDAHWATMRGHIHGICEKAASWGVRPVFHPHAGGYVEFADEIEQLVQDISYDELGLCLDTGHLRYAGMDPIALLRQYADRTDYIHFKDIDEAVYRTVLGQHIRFFDACSEGVMCPIGAGMLNYPAIFDCLTNELDYEGYITVEQERDPRHSDSSLRDVQQSRDYLKVIGFE
jgi:inosose dehydratase